MAVAEGAGVAGAGVVLSSSFGPSEIFLFLVLVKATVTVSLFTMLPLALEDAVV